MNYSPFSYPEKTFSRYYIVLATIDLFSVISFAVTIFIPTTKFQSIMH